MKRGLQDMEDDTIYDHPHHIPTWRVVKMKCQKCGRWIEKGQPIYYVSTNDAMNNEICSICHFHYSMLMSDICNSRKPEGRALIEYMRDRITEWFNIPDKSSYFMVLNNTHHNEASMTPLGMHDTDDSAVKSANVCIKKMDLDFGWNHKIYKVEDVGKIRELDIFEEFSPPIELLGPGEISWIFDEPGPR